MQRIFAILMVCLVLVAMMVVTTSTAFAAPGPGDKQCRGATGNGNPHCPPGT